jgi:uncharacterized membrane protein YeaQ/YmgE (transglycosylase-associated protein family)
MYLSLESIIIFLVVGIIVGWLAGVIWRGFGFGVFGNMVVGVVGAFIGGFIFNVLHIRFYGWGGLIISALIGALILLFIIQLVRRR